MDAMQLITHFKWRYLFLLLIFFSTACNHETPDFGSIDKKISAGHLEEARSALLKAARYSNGDSMIQKKIEYRLFKIDKYYFFKAADSLIHQAKWDQAAIVLDSLAGTVEKFPIGKKRKYDFDLYYRKYQVDAGQGDTATAFNDLKKAVANWTDNRELVQKVYGRLSFYYAERNQMLKAREMMDKALRLFDINKLTPLLRKVFIEYMDGHFEKALQLLKQERTEEKNETWLRLENFLINYRQKLTLKDRFKLW
jgi:tetratricopeptide (TPR) repeat protein